MENVGLNSPKLSSVFFRADFSFFEFHQSWFAPHESTLRSCARVNVYVNLGGEG